MQRQVLEHFINQRLQITDFADYGPNGLQIEGIEHINKVAFAVSATQESISQAINFKADALIVHHGLFWKFHGVKPITGPFARRIIPLIQNNINLFAYHLPLDGHPEIGNAAMIAQKLSLQKVESFGEYKKSPIGIKGVFTSPLTEQELHHQLEQLFNHPVTLSSVQPKRLLNSIGVITGGANGGWFDAYQAGLDAYLTGEMSEHDWHDAKEYGVSMFAAGHHATERLGIQALQAEIEKKFPQLVTTYIELNNPA